MVTATQKTSIFSKFVSPQDTLKVLWKNLNRVPGGKKIFSRLFGRIVPYAGSITPYVEELGSGHAKIRLKDKRSVRNHLDSIHAVALVNLGEMTTGLPLTLGLPKGLRAILKGIRAEYLKKARGEIYAVASFDIPYIQDKTDIEIVASIYDLNNDCVCKVYATWRVGH